ncbi:MAG: hypothetical protein ACR5KV_08350 [Wolbachia sp.]
MAKNADGEVSNVVGQCVSDIKQYIERFEKQNSLSPSCSIREPIVTSHQQQQISMK